MAGMTPTQLTLRDLRRRGYLAAVVEHWNPFAHIRQDLFGIIDVIGVRENETIGVQSTTFANRLARVKKMSEADNIGALRDAGWILEVQGWRKVKNKWECVVEDMT
jgi:hypothetical protein